jgi:hypothetical protein
MATDDTAPNKRDPWATHPLRHKWQPAPPPIPAWLQAARMLWHSDPVHVEDLQRPGDETFNAAWLRLFGEEWAQAAEGAPAETENPIARFENPDAIYTLFAKGRVVMVYASSAMAICHTDVEPDPTPAAPEPAAAPSDPTPAAPEPAAAPEATPAASEPAAAEAPPSPPPAEEPTP